jgi:cysteinyl-tRNA synthetase
VTVRFHNTLSGSKEEFQPLEPGRAGIYMCGATVHDYTHIGNLRAFLVSDLLRRHLEWRGYQVTQVLNVTDVEDKIIAKAAAAGLSREEYVKPYEAALFEDLAALRALPATFYPRATEHVPEMIRLIQALLESGHAYTAEGDVYYRISSFPAYGSLARLDREGLRAGARVARDEYNKESVSDFALWKREDPLAAQVGAVWEAPFGRGRPGWHIECSAMSMRYLGDSFDIHGGGVDLIFPHHENEIAQSEPVTGRPLARYWIHNEHLILAGGDEMHKSLGNFVTLRDLLAAGHDPLAVRLFLIGNAHYRSQQRLDEAVLRAAGEQLRRLRDFAQRVRRLEAAPGPGGELAAAAAEARRLYGEAMDDDLNLPQALGHVFELVRVANARLDQGPVDQADRGQLRGLLEDADAHLALLSEPEPALESEIEALIEERERARGERRFDHADEIRERLRRLGIALEDTRDGVRWRRVRPG